MDEKNKILKNSAVGLISQVSTILFAFLTRNLFLEYIGLELLGVSSTFLSIAGSISLAELGFHTAIVFSLYKPLHEKNWDEINEILNVLRIIYRVIGIGFVAISLVLVPFLPYILKETTITPYIYLCFILQMAASACTYFFSYKRALLYADQKNYIAQSYDMVVNIACNTLQCITIVLFHSYMIYVAIKLLQTLGSNLIVHGYCRKAYPALKGGKLSKTRFCRIWKDTTNIFQGRIAGYIYSSTDNLIVSAFVGTIAVGYLANYKTIFSSLTTLTNSILAPVTPFIGNYLVEEKGTEDKEKTFLVYTHIRFLFALLIIIPTLVLIEDFVVMWIGREMVLSRVIVILISADLYISLVHGSAYDFLNAAGMFRYSKYIEMLGAATNLALSLFLVRDYGMGGVLAGTVISQMVFWIGRSYIVYRYCLKANMATYGRYWLRNLGYCIYFAAAMMLCSVAYALLPVQNLKFRFLLGGLLCETILAVLSGVCLSGFKEQQIIIKAIKQVINKSRS